MDFLKAIEYLGKGIFDSIVTAPYALGNFIAPRKSKIPSFGRSALSQCSREF